MTLGERLVRLRAEAGLSQDQLAEQLAVSRQSVSKWENGISVPDLDNLVKLSEVFCVSLDQLVKGVDSSARPNLRWQKAAQLYHEKGYLLGWILVVWGTWGLLRSIWNCLITLPVLGTWGVLQLFFTGLLTAHIQNFLKILAGALLVLYGKRRAGRLRWYSLAWGLAAVGAFGIPQISTLRTGLVPFLLAIAQASLLITDRSEWGELFTGLLRESGRCLLLLLLSVFILCWSRRQCVPADSDL